MSGDSTSGHRFHPSLLREYDMRGVFGETLTARDAWAVGRSFASVVARRGGRCVAVGRDGRLSAPTLEAALIEGLGAGGIDVQRLGLCPTPAMYYWVASQPDVDGGIEVTGSHNPKDHNGFKFDLGGQPFFGDDIVELGRIAAAGDWADGDRAGGDRIAGTCESVDWTEAYCARIVRVLDGMDPPHGAGLTIGWDAGNGAAGPAIEALTRRLPGTHVLFHTRVDGHFPNHHPDPTVPENCQDLVDAVARGNIDIGFAFDGDGDRLGVIDGRGRIIWGDQLLLMLAEDLLQRRPNARIMADVKSSQVLFDRIAALGGEAIMAPTGHALIKSGMKQSGALLGGELTGHLFLADGFYGHDDALYAALTLLAAAARRGSTLTAWRDGLPETCATPDLRLPVPGIDPFAAIARLKARLDGAGIGYVSIDGARVTTPDGWWLLRASNTQAMLTARAESGDAAGLTRVLADMDHWLAQVGVAR